MSPDGAQLAAGLTSGQVARWSLDAGASTPLGLTPVSTFWINGVAFSPDGRSLLTGDSEQRLHVWASDTMEHLRVLRAPAIVQSVGWIGAEPMATSVDGTLLHWTATSRLLRDEGGRIYYLAGDAKGARWLAGTDQSSSRLELWGLGAGAGRHLVLPVPAGLDTSVATAMAPSGDRVFGATRDGQVIVWDVSGEQPGTPRVSQIADEANLVVVDVSPDGTLLAAGLYGGRGTVLARVGADLSVTPITTVPTQVPQLVTFSPDSRHLQVGIASGSVQVWDIADPAHPTLTATLDTASNPGASAFSPVGHLLAASTDGGEVHLWDWSDPTRPTEVRRLLGPRAGINAVAFSPDGRLLIAAGLGDHLWGWDLTANDPDPEFSLPAEMGVIHDIQFVEGGARVAATGASGEVRVWDIGPDAARTSLCAQRGQPLTADEWSRYLPGITPFDPCR